VGRGTPIGELFRRYWHPVATSKEATSVPRKIRVLGEDLVLFRDGEGRPDLVYPRCAHRGANQSLLRQGRRTRHQVLLPRLALLGRLVSPSPLAKALGGQVIGSAPRPFRCRSGARVSPV
jgi:hypothetical protein